MRSCFGFFHRPQAINLKKPAYNDGHFCYWAVRIVVFFDDWCGNSIPKRKIDLRLTDYLFVCWGCGRNEIFWQWAMRFHGLLCIRTDGMLSTDYSPVSRLFGSREKNKNNWLYTQHTAAAHTYTHITTNFVRVQVRSIIIIIKKKPPETFTDWLVCPVFIDLSIHACSVCVYIQWGRDEYNNYRQSERG